MAGKGARITKAILGGLGGFSKGVAGQEWTTDLSEENKSLKNKDSESVEVPETKEEVSPEDAVKVAEMAEVASTALSDEKLKNIYGDAIDDRILEDFAKLNAIDFVYSEEAREKFGCDNEKHTGVIAQDLESTPSTQATVIESPEGVKMVNTAQLTLADTAAISELAREVKVLKEVVKSLQMKIGGEF